MGKSREQHKIIVVGLPPGTTSADLTKLCKPVGNPLSCNMAVDADGKERGFGFVQFSDEATQQKAIAALNQKPLNGRTLNVRAVEERAPGAAKPERTAGGTKGRPCYDFARGKCAKGAACKWAHVIPDEGPSSRRPEWQKKRALAGSSTVPEQLHDIPEDYCRKYQLGTCHRGNSCRWKHLIWKPQGLGATCFPTAESAKPSGATESKRARVAEPAAVANGENGHRRPKRAFSADL